MFTQLVHISICNVLLLTPGYLMHTRFRSDKTSDECIHYNFTRVVLRSILFFTTIILYLPATGHARFQLYKLRDKPKAPGPVLERSFFLKLCESVALCDIILIIRLRGDLETPPLLSSTRTHVLFQHGIFTHEKSDTTVQGPQSAQDALRRQIWSAVMQHDYDNLTSALAQANSLDSNFATSWYPSGVLQCGGFVARTVRNPLHLAIKTNQPAMVTALLDIGFNPNARDKIEVANFDLRHVYTKVFCFFSLNHTERPSSYGPRSWFRHTLLTPLHMAVIHGDLDVLKELLEVGADPNRPALSNVPHAAIPPLFWVGNVQDAEHGFYLTPYEDAILNGRHSIARTLETWGSDIALTPLHDAAAKGDVNEMERLLSHERIDVNVLGEQSNAVRGQVAAARLLLQNGADIEAKDVLGRTPLAWACYLNHKALVAMVLGEFDANANARDALGRTIAILCADQEDMDAEIFYLLRNHGLVDFGQLENGDTPLHIAMKRSHQRTAIALVRAGSSSSLTTVNSEGIRAIDATSSSELQFMIKKEAGERDVMISYSHNISAFALKLRASLEANCLTTLMDEMDPTGINGGSVWRDEIARSIKNAAVLLCVLSEDYPKSQWCMKELAFAKEHNVPVVAALAQATEMTDELQVYLWSRQLVDFRDREGYDHQLRALLDGLRAEVEMRRTCRKNAKQRFRFGRPTSMVPVNLNASFVYISHGHCHPDVAKRLQEGLWERGVLAYVDHSHAFVPLLSERSCESAILSDQLAFAENREKRIVPLLYSKNFLPLAHEYTLSRVTTVVHFNDGLAFNQSLTKLAQILPMKATNAVSTGVSTRGILHGAKM
ncbi:unnamed protein product [Aphanomyces euteiches]